MDFDPLAMSHEEAVAIVKSMVTTTASYPAASGTVVEIPVCYDSEFGPDLEDVATYNGLTTSEVVRAHCGADYQVAFLGFTAGFAYLDGMPKSLSTPRLATPRRAVPAGQRRDRRRANGHLSGGDARGVEAYWADAAAHVRPKGRPADARPSGGPRPLCAHQPRLNLSDWHTSAHERSCSQGGAIEYGARRWALRFRASGDFAVRGSGCFIVTHRQYVGG